MYVLKNTLLFVFYLILVLCISCSKDKSESQKDTTLEEKEYIMPGESEKQLYDIDMNYDSLMVVFEQTTEVVSTNPFDIDARKKLVETCYDSVHQRIITFGYGRPPINARTPSVGLKFAERAAKIQAYRWAAYVQRWHNDPTSSDTTLLATDIPAGQLLSKLVLPDSTVKILVEIKISLD